MDKTAAIICHAFLQKHPIEQQNLLLKYLPSSEAKQLRELGPTRADPSKGILSGDEEIDQVHYSWFAPFLRALPESDIRLFLSSLHPEQSAGLKKQLLFSNHLPQLSPIASQFLKQALFDKITPPDLLPATCLPESRLNILLDLNLEEWDSLIDLLSIHDLSVEIRHVIDNVRLQQIHQILTKAQQTYLKTLLLRKEPVCFKKLGLANWDSDPEKLKKSLIQRGINRIAKALYGHDSSLLWYLSHRLSMERGNTLVKLCTPLDHPRAAGLLIDQVVELAESIKPHNPAT